ncbi:coiled-coil domain-containing protein [Herbiconiux sp. A18JL235]|uniref:Coiled-coil domain-containing protein n=1 Tax=Herbiconiux sp. A18JL235 TaxID=3152363 RepID=A0AB39BCU7_9MICO
MWKPSARSWTVVTVTAALVLGVGLPASAAPLVRDDPTWDDVQAAKQNAQAKQQEVENITSIIATLEDEAAARADEAFARGQEYLKASYDLQAASGYADTLTAQAADAQTKADTAKAQIGQLVAQLYRAGGDSTLNLILEQKQSDQLLYRLGTMSKLTEQTAGIRDRAVAAQNTADALTAQADRARAERDRLATEANERLAAAEDAQAVADAKVADNQTRKQTLTAQLATLNDRSVEVERAYLASEAYKAAQRAAEEAAKAAERAKAAEEEQPGSAWVPGSGEVASPAEAQAFAASQMGNYGWGGGQFDCLVQLWIGESGWRANAYNPSSGAYGIPQSLPASKMASVGADYVTNAATQIIWGMNYISDRYGTPCGALSAWQARSPHWY